MIQVLAGIVLPSSTVVKGPRVQGICAIRTQSTFAASSSASAASRASVFKCFSGPYMSSRHRTGQPAGHKCASHPPAQISRRRRRRLGSLHSRAAAEGAPERALGRRAAARVPWPRRELTGGGAPPSRLVAGGVCAVSLGRRRRRRPRG